MCGDIAGPPRREFSETQREGYWLDEVEIRLHRRIEEEEEEEEQEEEEEGGGGGCLTLEQNSIFVRVVLDIPCILHCCSYSHAMETFKSTSSNVQ